MAVTAGPVAVSNEAEQAMFDFVDAYDRAFEAAAMEHALSVAQACVLARLTRPWGMRALADELGCDASNITQVVSRLEARDLVAREVDPHDGRARLVARTSNGDAAYAAFARSFEFARTAMANLSPGEQEQLTTLLRKALDS